MGRLRRSARAVLDEPASGEPCSPGTRWAGGSSSTSLRGRRTGPWRCSRSMPPSAPPSTRLPRRSGSSRRCCPSDRVGARRYRAQRPAGGAGRWLDRPPGVPSLADRVRALPALVPAFGATLRPRSSTAMLERLAAAGDPVVVIHGDRDLVTGSPPVGPRRARPAGSSYESRAVDTHGCSRAPTRCRHRGIAAGRSALPAAAQRRFRRRALRAGALALTLDKPSSRPYQLRAGHVWRLEPLT